MEATYSGSATFSKPTDSDTNNWIEDKQYCSAYDCVEIWHAEATESGPDTVTFSTSYSGGYTYGFLREFVGYGTYGGVVDTTKTDTGTSGSPHVASFTPSTGDLVVAVAVNTNAGWKPGQYYTMIDADTAWATAAEFAPGWQQGSTKSPWGSPTSGDWTELVVAYVEP